ncbi:TRAP transporter substrate-binding protein [Actinobacteria bacterium YIM 96077]|uniref:C4-dicarboxylate ABC transporter substrate-binding protein n=1 Tax=Phytoactinopolyspora halophila TaxID=1981511 RepID=A0A329QSU7_9ACTN|nr:TRAP transporter substrate-binding protein [Phytoactinopolyspora halophila]AYY14997.1 TRAP transporter substrate-binding protein [Actinobacteria bacterium YIM 96077]RAW15454.1 C4-dicarboxylate ABC transporter substrate-binding protein [Phytoactinopolyspora halophila]
MRRSTMVRGRSVVGMAAAAAMLAACGEGAVADAEDADGESVGDEEAEISLRYAFFAPAASFPAVQMEEWAERLNERTDGRVSVELFPGGTLLESGDIFDGVSGGIAEVGMDSPAYDVGRFPLSSVMALPVDFPNSQVASRTMLDLLEEFEPEEFADYEIITAFTTEPAYIQSEEPVTSRDDLDGLEMRSAGAGVPALQALGASPVGMPMPEVAEGLQTGVLDGYMSSREVLQDFGLAEQVNYVTDYAFGISNTFVAVMDQSEYDNLPADVQEAIVELRPEMTEFASEYHDDQNVGDALEWAESEHGVEVVELDDGEREAWDGALEGLIDDWFEEAEGHGFDPQEVFDRMNELREQYTAELGS